MIALGERLGSAAVKMEALSDEFAQLDYPRGTRAHPEMSATLADWASMIHDWTRSL